MSKIADLVFNFAKPIVEKLGFELVDVAYTKTRDGMDLSLSIYKDDRPITIEDCEKVSKALDEPLDELNPTCDESYTLSVGSLGLDRPIITDADFKRSMGKEIELSLYKAQDGDKNFVGILKGFNDNNVEIESINKKLTIARANIASAKLYIKI